MPSCCYPDEYGKLFSSKDAQRDARRYVRGGLSGSQKVLADALKDRGIDGASILEVGGGVGALQVELLRSGAGAATNVELSPGWEEAARGLLTRYGIAEQAERRVEDFVDNAETFPMADAVVLHRVVCCYPHWRTMLDGAAGRARRIVALTFPVDRTSIRIAARIGNLLLRLGKRRFRAFVHPPVEMLSALTEAGLEVTFDDSGFLWRSVLLERACCPGPRSEPPQGSGASN